MQRRKGLLRRYLVILFLKEKSYCPYEHVGKNIDTKGVIITQPIHGCKWRKNINVFLVAEVFLLAGGDRKGRE